MQVGSETDFFFKFVTSVNDDTERCFISYVKMLTSQSQKVLDLQDYIWLYCASRLQRIFCVLRVQRTCLV